MVSEEDSALVRGRIPAHEFRETMDVSFLLLQAKARLSWQYHNRRAEIWQVYKGSAGIIRSNTDVESPMEIYSEGAQIVLAQGERHRLIGLDDFCVVAEIWQHTDQNYPSDESDIIRVQDDFGR